LVNRGGPGFVRRLTEATSADAGQVAAAFCLARDAYGLERLYGEIDALDGQVPGTAQLALYAEIGALLERETLWLLRNADFTRPMADLVLHYAEGITDVAGMIGSLAPPALEATIDAKAESFIEAGIPQAMARRIAELGALGHATDVVMVADRAKAPVAQAAAAFFGVLDMFGLPEAVRAAEEMVLADPLERMALDRVLANLMRAQRDLTADVLAAGRGDIDARLAAWRAVRTDAVARVAENIAELTGGAMSVSRLTVAAGLLSDLARSS
jgi:glutamate dehydrogenase